MPAVPGGTVIGIVYVAAPVSLTLKLPGVAPTAVAAWASRGVVRHRRVRRNNKKDGVSLRNLSFAVGVAISANFAIPGIWIPAIPAGMTAFPLVPKLQLGNPSLTSSCLPSCREAGASKTAFPSRSLGTSKRHRDAK